MAQEEGGDRFHSSELEDVYDLYNVCNGALQDSFLVKQRLNELSPEEAEILNVSRLKQVWDHIASGCAECEAVITTLNRVRGMLGEKINKPFQETTGANHND